MLTSVHQPFDVRIFEKEARSLVEAGHEVFLFAPADFDEQIVHGVHVVGVPKHRRILRPLTWAHLLYWALRLHADVYHLHDLELLPLGVLLKWVVRSPVIYDAHEYYPEAMLAREWIPSPLRRPASVLVRWFERWGAKILGEAIVVEDSQAKRFRAYGCRVTTVYNFPRIELCQTPFNYLFSDTATVIYAGSLMAERGLFHLLDAWAEVVNFVPEARLLLVGKFPHKDIEIAFQRKVEAAGLKHTVELIGFVPHAKLGMYLSQAMIGVVPVQPVAQYDRIVPTKMFEYMLFGLPVVASDISTVRRFMDGCDCGVLVESHDAGQLAQAIIHLLRHPEEVYRMGMNGRKTVLEKYNWATMAERLVRLYARLNAGRR